MPISTDTATATSLSIGEREPVPANRSRTLEWRRCLRQICDRNGAIEIAVAKAAPFASSADLSSGTPSPQLVWRVHILDVMDSEIIVERPTAMGQEIPLKPGVALVGILSIGQNRWVFRTVNMGETDHPISHHHGGNRTMPALRLLMPDSVERCQRRSYYRVDTNAGSLNLPSVEVWPLLDPQSVVLAERAAEMRLHIANCIDAGDDDGTTPEHNALVEIMPEVGPKFRATLLNIGGGGIGLLVEPEDAHLLGRHRLLWMRFALPPDLDVPICATGKVVHTHMESSHQVYVGAAFDFTFNPAHQRCVVDQICRYIALQQREQLERLHADGSLRESA